MGDSFRILYRESTKWDDIGSRFEADLRIRNVDHDELNHVKDLVHKGTHAEGNVGANDFLFMWRRETQADHSGLLQQLPDPSTILGTLEIHIPYITIRDEVVCREVADLLEHPYSQDSM